MVRGCRDILLDTLVLFEPCNYVADFKIEFLNTHLIGWTVNTSEVITWVLVLSLSESTCVGYI